MKIILSVNCLSKGGAERVASLWANGFAKFHHDVYVALFDNQRPISYSISLNVKINYIVPTRSNKIARYISRLLMYRQYIKKVNPDVILAVQEPYGWWSKLAVFGLGKKIIYTDHNAYEWPKGNSEVNRFRHFEKYHLNRIFDAITVLTDVDRKLLLPKKKETYTMPNPVSFEVCDSVPAKSKVILAAGRLDVWQTKGFDLLIRAWGKLCAKFPDWELPILGDGSDCSKEFLTKLAINLDCGSQIKFLGFKNNIIDYYRSSEIFVLSSRFEGFGMVLTEAMSQGCACIACDWKGRQKEIIRSREEGLVCPSGDVKELTRALGFLLVDDEYRACIQRNALIRAREFEIDKIIERWELLFKDLNLYN